MEVSLMLDWTRLTPAVKSAASAAASNFPAHHDVSDVEQELWVWIMSKKPTVIDVLKREDGEGILVNMMIKVANTYLKQEDAAVYGYAEDDRFTYSLDMIKSILEVVFEHEDWQSIASAIGDGMPRAKSEPALGGNNLASYADVSRAISKLPDDYYNLLVWRYKYQKTFTQIGEETDTTKQAVSERHSRALKAIQVLLGQQSLSELRKGYDGRTEARGNASGQARIERDYQG
jgi:DNA-directed RNA polymerase specialized sigma24 family protein